jgi:hypothetical protein
MSENIANHLSETQPNQPSNAEKGISQQPTREIESRQRDTFLSLYSNNITVRVTPFDIQLILGEIISLDERKLVIENLLAVNLSPQTAKSLLNVLSGQIDTYERQFGEIRYNPLPQKPDTTPAFGGSL